MKTLRTWKYAAKTLLLILSLVAMTAHGQNAERQFEDYIEYDHHIELLTSDGKIAITPISNKIMEIQFLTERQPANQPSWSVIKEAENVDAEVKDSEQTITYTTSGISVEIVKKPFQIKYSYKGKPLVSENAGYFEAEGNAGFKFNLAEDESIYGGGERAVKMDRRGYKFPLYNTPAYGYADGREDMYFSIPLAISSKQYMILWDNAPKGSMDIGKTEEGVLSFDSIGGRKVYYLIAGDSFFDLNTQYSELTGYQPLPPRWTLGYIASRFGYHTQAEAEDTISKFREQDVPVDSIVIDLYWFGKDIQGHMGNLDWNYDAWPKPKKMMKDFRKDGVETVLITEPFILNTSANWQAALDADILTKNYRGEPYIFDFYFGTSGLIDIFKPEAKAWFWDIYKKHTESGVSAWWGDLGEPESHASDMVHVAGTADYVHNVFGHEWAKMMYEGYRKDFPKRRPMALMRAGFAGSQRYGMIPWSGDVSRSWEGLKPQPALTLQMGMQGLAYGHSDLGGFAEHYVDDKLFSDPMLYTRWLQYGVFQPVFRPHSQDSSPPEPVFWDEKTLNLTRAAIDLRYQLYPYNYTLAYQNSTKGYPFMRPLFYIEPDNEDLRDYSATYLWGDAILVAPILEPKQKTQHVYFPKTANWVDYYTGQLYQGGKSASVDVVEDYIPTFVKTGTFVPMIPKGLQTTRDYSTKELHVLYFADNATPSTSYTLYDDDGSSSYSIANNTHELLTFTATNTDDTMNIKVASNGGKFKGKPKKRAITFFIDKLTSIPTSIIIDGKSIAVSELSATKKSKHHAQKISPSKLAITLMYKGGESTLSF